MLRSSLVTGKMTPADLASASTDELANDKLRAEREEARQKSLKDSVIMKQSGPIIVRDHKGERVLEARNNEVKGYRSPPPTSQRSPLSPKVDGSDQIADDPLTMIKDFAMPPQSPPHFESNTFDDSAHMLDEFLVPDSPSDSKKKATDVSMVPEQIVEHVNFDFDAIFEDSESVLAEDEAEKDAYDPFAETEVKKSARRLESSPEEIFHQIPIGWKGCVR